MPLLPAEVAFRKIMQEYRIFDIFYKFNDFSMQFKQAKQRQMM